MRRVVFILSLILTTGSSLYAQKTKNPIVYVTPYDPPKSQSIGRDYHYPSSPGDTSYYLVEEINIEGNNRSKEQVIYREMNVFPGDTIYTKDVEAFQEESRLRLINSSLFLSVKMKATKTGSHALILDITVSERQYFVAIPEVTFADRNFNVWWVEHHHKLDRVNWGLKLYQTNLTGMSDPLVVSLNVGYSRRIRLAYKFPYLDRNLRHGLGLSLAFSQLREVNFGSDSNRQNFFTENHFQTQDFRAGLNYTYKKAIKAVHSVSLSYNSTKIADTILKINPQYFPDAKPQQKFLSLGYSFSYNNTDVWSYPLHGYSLQASFSRSGLGLLGKVKETYVKGIFNQYWEFLPRLYGESSLKGMMRFPKNQAYFLEQGMGYANQYLRGLEYYVAEGDRFGIMNNTLKYELLSFEAHTRALPKKFSIIPLQIFVKAFGDMGYNHSSINLSSTNDILSNRMLYTYGVGIDIVTFYDSLFKLEYSFNQLGEKGLFLHFFSEF